MKSYTDFEQSKRLADFLPVESADMRYHTISHYDPYCDEIVYTVEFGKASGRDIPCWSLSAMLEYLRKIDLFPNIIDSNDCVLMDISFYDYKDTKVLLNIQCLRVEGKTILDTCYAMIMKLHELKLV